MQDKNTQAIIREVCDYIFKNLDSKNKIIDLGCSNCYILDNLYKFGYNNLLGVDINIPSDKKNYSLIKINLTENNWSENVLEKFGKFNLAIATEVIEHLANPLLFLSEISKILENNGTLILTFPNVHNLKSKILYLFFDRFSKFFGKNFQSKLHPIFEQHIFVPNLHLVRYFLTLNSFKIKEIRYINGLGKLFSESIFLISIKQN